jgi:4-amino-4-deoxy-L-arabinose transferase-like glycosyltransferase
MVKSEIGYLKIAFAILVVALVLRVTWGALVPVVPMSDSKAYEFLARTLAEYGVYGWSAARPSAYWPPGTSAVYAALYSVFGQSFTPIVILNIILSTGVVGLTMWLGSIFLGKMTGLLAGFLMAIWPSEVFYVTILASELPFSFFVLLGVTAWFNLRLPNSVRVVTSGLAFGAATYFRPIALLLPIVLWLSALPKWQKLREGLPVILFAMVIIGLAITPWSVRNAKIFGHFVPMSTSDGVNLWMGNNANSDGYYMPLPASIHGLSEYDQNKVLGEEAWRYILDNPGPFILRSIKKAALLHISETIAVIWNTEGIKQRFGENVLLPLKLITRGFWTAVLLFALGGVAILVRMRGILQTLMNPTVLIWIYFTAVYSIFVASDRYHFPSHPYISMLAAVAILASVRRLQSRNGSVSPVRDIKWQRETLP